MIGAVMYVLAAVLLVAGGVWWFGAAPDTGVDPRLAVWHRTVHELLPDRFEQIDAQTVSLRLGTAAEQQVDVSPGTHVLDVVCAGGGRVWLRMGTGSPDSGRVVQCADEPTPVTITMGLVNELLMTLELEADQLAIVRWQLSRMPT